MDEWAPSHDAPIFAGFVMLAVLCAIVWVWINLPYRTRDTIAGIAQGVFVLMILFVWLAGILRWLFD